MPLYDEGEDWRPPKRFKFGEVEGGPKPNIRPLGKYGVMVAKPHYEIPSISSISWISVKSTLKSTFDECRPKRREDTKVTKARLDRIIAEAAAAAEAERTKAVEEAAAAAAAAAEAEAHKEHKKSSHRQKKQTQTPEDKEANKEKRLLKLVGAVVVKYMSKYQDQMDHDTFKKHAKEVTHFFEMCRGVWLTPYLPPVDSRYR